MTKIVKSIKKVLKLVNIKDGMTISFHHHLRNGDYVMNLVLEEIAEIGVKNLTLAATGIYPIHQPLIKKMENKVITKIDTDFVSGPVGEAIVNGKLQQPAIFRSRGGRARAIETKELKIDIAFIASPSADSAGNINGVDGPSACGPLGYAIPDAHYADKVIAITDNLVDYPLFPVRIEENLVDYVVVVDKIGNAQKIMSGTTIITRDPIGLRIAKYALQVIEQSGLFKTGFSFQTGAGGISLAVADCLHKKMKEKNIIGSFALGGITKFLVDMLNEGLLKTLLNVQSFDLDAVKSVKENPQHQAISVSRYANPKAKSCAVDNLDISILGASEIDTNFNVNVVTDSNGIIIGGSGGHNDSADGSKLTIIVTPLIRGRFPVVVDKLTTVTTPGRCIDVVVTERGIAVNPNNKEIEQRLMNLNLPIVPISKLKEVAYQLTGKPEPIKFYDRIVGKVEERNGEIIDYIRMLKY